MSGFSENEINQAKKLAHWLKIGGEMPVVSEAAAREIFLAASAPEFDGIIVSDEGVGQRVRLLGDFIQNLTPVPESLEVLYETGKGKKILSRKKRSSRGKTMFDW